MTEREKRFIDEKFPDEAERLDAYRRLESHEPLAYILGEWYFYDEKYIVTPDVLVPRSDTEILVGEAIKRIPRDACFLDLCTGSGCVAISTLKHRSDLRAIAVDISQKALCVAAQNAALNGVSDRISFIHADLLDENDIPKGEWGALLSNPPYISESVIAGLQPEVRGEPYIALNGGSDGLNFYRAIAGFYRNILARGAPVLLEIGYDQAESVKRIFGGGEVIRDYGGNDRVFISKNV